MGCGSACSDNFVLSILPTWNQNFFFRFRAGKFSSAAPTMYLFCLCFHAFVLHFPLVQVEFYCSQKFLGHIGTRILMELHWIGGED